MKDCYLNKKGKFDIIFKSNCSKYEVIKMFI